MSLHTEFNFGTTGAKRATYRDVSPRALLERFISLKPKASQHEWRKQFFDYLNDHEEYMRVIIDWWLDNQFRELLRAPENPTQKAEKNAVFDKTAANIAANLKDRIAQEAKVIVLSLLMPNNKLLGDCTGAECKKFGGWFGALAQRVPAKTKVKDAISEAEAHKLWAAAK
jgi:hypothetical protein